MSLASWAGVFCWLWRAPPAVCVRQNPLAGWRLAGSGWLAAWLAACWLPGWARLAADCTAADGTGFLFPGLLVRVSGAVVVAKQATLIAARVHGCTLYIGEPPPGWLAVRHAVRRPGTS